MEDFQSSSFNGSKKNSKSIVFIVLTIMFFTTSVVLTLELMQSKDISGKATVENIALKKEKEKILTSLEQLEDEFSVLEASSAGQKEFIQEQKQKIEQLKAQLNNTDISLNALKAQIVNLQFELKEYERRYTALKKENEKITSENLKIRQTLDSALVKTVKLEKETGSILEKGSMLKAYEIVAAAIRISNGNELTTQSVSRAEKIKVSFTISENLITKSGTKTIYLRISQPPAGEILVKKKDPTNTFVFNKGKLYYSVKKEINYENKSLKETFYWEFDKSKTINTGKYYVEIFVDNYHIGSAMFKLD